MVASAVVAVALLAVAPAAQRGPRAGSHLGRHPVRPQRGYAAGGLGARNHGITPVLLERRGSSWVGVALPPAGQNARLYLLSPPWAGGVADALHPLSVVPIFFRLAGGRWQLVPGPGSPPDTDLSLTAISGGWAVGYTAEISTTTLLVQTLHTLILRFEGGRWRNFGRAAAAGGACARASCGGERAARA